MVEEFVSTVPGNVLKLDGLYRMKHTPTNKDILQTQDMSYKKDKTQLFNCELT